MIPQQAINVIWWCKVKAQTQLDRYCNKSPYLWKSSDFYCIVHEKNPTTARNYLYKQSIDHHGVINSRQ